MKRIDEVIGTYNFREYHWSVQVVLLRSLKRGEIKYFSYRRGERKREDRREREEERREERRGDEIFQIEKRREKERKRVDRRGGEKRRDERLSNVN